MIQEDSARKSNEPLKYKIRRTGPLDAYIYQQRSDDENKEDIIGISGEIAFGKRYNLKPDLEIKPNGDGHIDFKIRINGDKIITIDIFNKYF